MKSRTKGDQSKQVDPEALRCLLQGSDGDSSVLGDSDDDDLQLSTTSDEEYAVEPSQSALQREKRIRERNKRRCGLGCPRGGGGCCTALWDVARPRHL